MLKPLTDVISPFTCISFGFRYVHDLNKLINRYHFVMDSLSEEHLSMLVPQIEPVKKQMNFGCKRLNWSSLGTLPTEAELSV